ESSETVYSGELPGAAGASSNISMPPFCPLATPEATAAAAPLRQGPRPPVPYRKPQPLFQNRKYPRRGRRPGAAPPPPLASNPPATYEAQNQTESAMNILILGSGGREHALAWAVKQNPKCDRLIVAPGNAGIGQLAELAEIDILSGAEVVAFCEANAIDFLIVGPE